MKEKTNFPYDVLVDGLDVVNLYGLKDEELMEWDYIDDKVRKNKVKREISLSSTIVISQRGVIEYQYSGHYRFRPDNESILAVLRKI